MDQEKTKNVYRKKDLIEGLLHTGVGNIRHTSQAEAVFKNICDQIVYALLSGKSVIIPGVLKLTPTLRKGRKGVHPRTRARFDVPPRVTVKLKIATTLRQKLQSVSLDPMLGVDIKDDESVES